MRSADDERVYQEWKLFKSQFPRKDNNNPHAHFEWKEKHKGDPSKWHVPFADEFSSKTFKVYDDTARDALQHGISKRIELLPKAKSMPSVLRCQPKKGSAQDINPREFTDVTMGTVRRPQRERETNDTSRLFTSKKRAIDEPAIQNTGNDVVPTTGTAIVTSKRQRVNGVAIISNHHKPIMDKLKRAKDKLQELFNVLPPWNFVDSGEIVDFSDSQRNDELHIRGRGRGRGKK